MDHPDAVVDGLTIRNGYNPSNFGRGVYIYRGKVQNLKPSLSGLFCIDPEP